MLRSLMTILTAAQLLLGGVTGPQLTLTTWFKTGEMLRLHVVAQDDTTEMQRIKLCVKDAVQACYRENSPLCEGTMLKRTEALLPVLTKSAIETARAEGFDGTVRVELDVFHFDERPLGSTSLPEGEYPALMVFLGDAQGHNWWGLIDPDTARWMARIPGSETKADIRWDWSLEGLLAALFGLSPAGEG